MQIPTNKNKSDQLDVLAEFIAYDESQYGNGMENLAIAYLNREKAIQGKCSFFDPLHINGDIGRLNRELCGQSNPVLITSSINVYADERLAGENNRNAHYNLLKNTLNAISHCNKDFNKIFIPIGCQEANMAGHNIGLILEKDRVGFKATILDQMGGSSYADTKAQIIENLNAIGIKNIDYNRHPMSYNRNDCATITSLFADLACGGEDMRALAKQTDNYYSRNHTPGIKDDTIDMQHAEDQKILRSSAEKLAKEMIKETEEDTANPYSQLRGLSDILSHKDVVRARIKKYSDHINRVSPTRSGKGRY